MPTAHHICRLAGPKDILRTAALWAEDRPLFDEYVWPRLPGLLEKLMRAELVRLAVIELLPSREPRMLGGFCFIEPEYVAETRASGSTLPNIAMRAALDGREPFLPPTKIAKMNAQSELHLMNFFGNIKALDLRQSETSNFHAVCNRGYHFFHFGYAYRAMWVEVWPLHHVQELQNQGMQIEREMKLQTGETSTLMCLTPERALANPYARRSGFFFPPAPRFRFSLGEQNVLEWTMLGLADDEIAAKVHVSMDAIKKRWRSIYTKVENVDPGLLATADSGTAQRRELLSYLEVHLEEIRPYSW
ncbi:MAG TPA: hypothetical protein VF783_25285 [Terriglobales bacterium]